MRYDQLQKQFERERLIELRERSMLRPDTREKIKFSPAALRAALILQSTRSLTEDGVRRVFAPQQGFRPAADVLYAIEIVRAKEARAARVQGWLAKPISLPIVSAEEMAEKRAERAEYILREKDRAAARIMAAGKTEPDYELERTAALRRQLAAYKEERAAATREKRPPVLLPITLPEATLFDPAAPLFDEEMLPRLRGEGPEARWRLLVRYVEERPKRPRDDADTAKLLATHFGFPEAAVAEYLGEQSGRLPTKEQKLLDRAVKSRHGVL